MSAATKTKPPRSRGSGSECETIQLVTLDPHSDTERLVKSADRVRDLGEVFTPAEVVQAMLDLFPADMWAPHPSPTFLEPACGDGNFVVAVLHRKLRQVAVEWASGTLPAGDDHIALEFHTLEALASIYAIDISPDNIVGGTPGHELGARHRLLNLLRSWYVATTTVELSEQSLLLRTARWIVERNVQVANMLALNADGTRSRRENIALVEYRWEPTTQSVTVAATTLGDVMAEAEEETAGTLSLFATFEPAPVWSGSPTRLHEAPIPAPTPKVRQVRNGNGCGRS